ncbi:hypothetical protein BWQ96_00171 [Gracilariopsis chorda]|uniref:Transmembrane protein n=1 Tax=Gracilariopsis chorda TaxID=448386 RepID=A0A2V3J6F9_9FLOR|nr:hypothetical protein BWQ96_00171 [Gracilariopsis chorda]|eukprot:PXF50011.1 hypothetical protein BWQ96_00171 [Gracilariopsis chorda]
MLLVMFRFLATACLAEEVACVPTEEHVTVPINVKLTYAGAPPLFMRESSWTPAAKQDFLQQLRKFVRHTALPSEVDDDTSAFLIGKLHPNACSVVQFSYEYDIHFVDAKTASQLDNILTSVQGNTPSMYVNGTAVADRFWEALQSNVNFQTSKHPEVYNVLMYNAMSVAPQYGYRAEEGSTIGTIAISSENRFAVIDVGAKPFFLQSAEYLTAGDLLMAKSGAPPEYASELHGIVSQLLTPPASRKMRRFPPETRLAFKLSLIDVSAVIGRMPGVAGDSQGNKSLGSTFSEDQFIRVLNTVFHNHAVPDKEVTVSIEKLDMTENANMAMAVSRAFSMKGLDMILDSESLVHSITWNASEQYRYFVDSSFVAHFPMYLFSFADDSRVTHFETGERVRAVVVDNEVLIMTENRLRDDKDEYVSTTSEATKEVLELLCGLGQKSLPFISSKNGVVPLILRDIAKRNIVIQEIDWSRSVAAWKSKELLNFEGLDSRLIPHDKGSQMAVSRAKIEKGLKGLVAEWQKASVSMSLENVESVTLHLAQISREMADRLHEEVCKQPLPEEILLKAEAEDLSEKKLSVAQKKSFALAVYLVLSAISGLVCGAYLHHKAVKKSGFRPSYLDDLSIGQTVRNFDVSTTTQWFSTLTSSYKSKTH